MKPASCTVLWRMVSCVRGCLLAALRCALRRFGGHGARSAGLRVAAVAGLAAGEGPQNGRAALGGDTAGGERRRGARAVLAALCARPRLAGLQAWAGSAQSVRPVACWLCGRCASMRGLHGADVAACVEFWAPWWAQLGTCLCLARPYRGMPRVRKVNQTYSAISRMSRSAAWTRTWTITGIASHSAPALSVMRSVYLFTSLYAPPTGSSLNLQHNACALAWLPVLVPGQ